MSDATGLFIGFALSMRRSRTREGGDDAGSRCANDPPPGITESAVFVRSAVAGVWPLAYSGAVADRQRLTRSNNKVIAGVCAGLAEYLGWNVTRFRIAFVLVSIVSAAFPGIFVYLVLWALMPRAEAI